MSFPMPRSHHDDSTAVWPVSQVTTTHPRTCSETREYPLVLTCQQQGRLICCVLSVGFSFVFLPLFSQMKYTPNQSKFPETAGWSLPPCVPNDRTAPVQLLFQEPARPCRAWPGAGAACGEGRPLPHSAPGPMWLVSRFWGGVPAAEGKVQGGPLVPTPFCGGPTPPPPTSA